MHRLVLVLVLVLGCHKKPAQEAPKRDAGPIEIDWARCEQALSDSSTLPDSQRTKALLDGCPVCGDWKPLIEWGTLTEDGGPKRLDIMARMDSCRAYCNSDAKRRFNATIDEARGRNSRAPWRYLGEQCGQQVSAVPDARFMSAPYFALDRIARAVAAHSSDDAALLAKLDLPLPAFSLTGAGLELPDPPENTTPAPAIHITLLGDGVHVGRLPRARLGPNGVTVDFGGEPYPGPAVALDKVSAAVHALDPSPHPRVALFMAAKAPTEPYDALVQATPDLELVVAVIPATSLPGWPIAVGGTTVSPPAK